MLPSINLIKLLNLLKNAQFAQDADFVFVAQQFVERYLLEGQIDVATRKGSINRKDGKLIQLDDGHDIFKKIETKTDFSIWEATNLF